MLKNRWIAITLLTLAAITALSLWPLEFLPAVPGNDKTHHFIAYAALMLPTALRMPKHWLLIGLFFIIWSGAIELIQPYVNRYGEWLDLAANVAGLLSGLIIARFINYLLSTNSRQL